MPAYEYLTEAQYEETASKAVDGETLRALVEHRDDILPLIQISGLRLASLLYWKADAGDEVHRDTSVEAITIGVQVAVSRFTDFCTVTHFNCFRAFGALIRAQMDLMVPPSDAYLQG